MTWFLILGPIGLKLGPWYHKRPKDLNVQSMGLKWGLQASIEIFGASNLILGPHGGVYRPKDGVKQPQDRVLGPYIGVHEPRVRIKEPQIKV